MAETLSEHVREARNGIREEKPYVFDAKKVRWDARKRTVILHFPSHDREIELRKKLSLNGWFKDPKAKIEVPLHPSMDVNAGERIHIDAERGVQIKYEGLGKGWVGIDGRFTYSANISRIMEQINLANNAQLLMWMKIAAISALLALAATVGLIIYYAKNTGH